MNNGIVCYINTLKGFHHLAKMSMLKRWPYETGGKRYSMVSNDGNDRLKYRWCSIALPKGCLTINQDLLSQSWHAEPCAGRKLKHTQYHTAHSQKPGTGNILLIFCNNPKGFSIVFFFFLELCILYLDFTVLCISNFYLFTCLFVYLFCLILFNIPYFQLYKSTI